MSPTVSSIRSPTCILAKELTRILTPYQAKLIHSDEVCHICRMSLRSPRQTQGMLNQLWSYQSVHTGTNQLSIASGKSKTDEGSNLDGQGHHHSSTAGRTFELCFRSTYFQFHNEFFEKIDGTHLGSSYPHYCQPVHGGTGGESVAVNSTPTQPLIEVCV